MLSGPMDPRQSLQSARDAFRAGRFADAAELARQVLRRQPRNADAASLVGLSHLQQGDHDGAIKHLQSAATLRPSEPTFHVNLGIALLRKGQGRAAVSAFDRAIALKPDLAAAHYNRANALRELGDVEEAEDSYRAAMRARSGYAAALCNLANMLTDTGRTQEAIPLYLEAIESNPSMTAPRNSLGNALMQLGRMDDAIARFKEVLAASPADIDACTNLGNALRSSGRLAEAVDICQRALRLAPGNEVAANSLGNALLSQGRLHDALEAYRRALSIRSDYDTARSNLIMSLNYAADLEPDQVVEPARSWGSRMGAAITPHSSHANAIDPDRRLRIGYVSPDFRTHSCAYFLDPLFHNHDQAHYEVFAYAEVHSADAYTDRLREAAAHWRITTGVSDANVAQMVADDAIDILVDCAGHTGGNRLGVFAHRPAPVQVTWLGYPNTTGLAAIGYRIVDDITDPPEFEDIEATYVEERIRLPRTFICYAPPQVGAEVGSLPMQQSGRVTFGSFNNLPKMTERVIDLWAHLLKRVPDSRLLLKNRSLTDEGTRDRFRGMFEERGVAGERIENVGWTKDTREHLETYNQVDIALDTFPYHGTTTTCEALYMGVPVVCLMGRTHNHRVGGSLLRSVGMPELAVDSDSAYLEAACRLAGDVQQLSALRDTLRDRLLGSPLCNGPAFAGDFEAALRELWRRWCADQTG